MLVDSLVGWLALVDWLVLALAFWVIRCCVWVLLSGLDWKPAKGARMPAAATNARPPLMRPNPPPPPPHTRAQQRTRVRQRRVDVVRVERAGAL